MAEAGAPPDRVEPPSVENLAEARRAIEAMLLVASDPTPVQLLAQLIELPVDVVQAMCRELAAEYEREHRGFVLVEVAGGWRYQTHPDTHAYVERFALEGIPNRLSSAALETLAIVAYKQPISRGQIGAIRGVNVDGVLRTLVQRGYVDEQGRDEGPGQATLFGTTPFFLEQLGLMSLDDLPPLGDFVPSAEVLEALEQTLKVGPDEIDLTVDDDARPAPEAEVVPEAGPEVQPEVVPEPVSEVEVEVDLTVGAEPDLEHRPDREPEPDPDPVADTALPEAVEAAEDAPVFEVVTDAVDVVDRSVEPADDVAEDVAEAVEPAEPAGDVVEAEPIGALVEAEPTDEHVEAGEWLDEVDAVFTGDEADSDGPGPGAMEVAADSQVEKTSGTDAIGAPGVDDAERFRGSGDGPIRPEGDPKGVGPGPSADHGVGHRSPDPSADAGSATWPSNGHGPSGNGHGNGYRPDPGTGDA